MFISLLFLCFAGMTVYDDETNCFPSVLKSSKWSSIIQPNDEYAIYWWTFKSPHVFYIRSDSVVDETEGKLSFGIVWKLRRCIDTNEEYDIGERISYGSRNIIARSFGALTNSLKKEHWELVVGVSRIEFWKHYGLPQPRL